MATLDLVKNEKVVFGAPEVVFENDSCVVYKRTGEVLVSPVKYLGEVGVGVRGKVKELLEGVGRSVRVEDVDAMDFNTSIDLFLKQSKTGVHFEMRAKMNWGRDVRSDLFYHLKALSGMRSSNDLTFELKRGVGGGGGDVVFKTDLFQTDSALRLCEWWKGMQPSLHLLGVFRNENVKIEGVVLGLSVQVEVIGDDGWVFDK